MAAYTTIDNPELYFQTVLYTGNGGTNAITFDGSENMQPDFVWVKCRDVGHSHTLYDSVRTSPAKNFLKSDDTIAERTVAIGSFDSNGVTFTNNDGFNNGSGNYVIWAWKMNGSGSSNTEGSLNTTANSVSTTAGQSIISYTGNGTDGATIGHGLDTAPDVLLLKDRDNVRNWRVLHTGYGDASKNLLLNTTGAFSTRADDFNSTYPSSTLITLGGDGAVNGNTTKYIIYAFSSVKGYSKHGTYTGGGSDFPFIFTGFKPSWIMIKRSSDGTDRWTIIDNKRDSFNVSNTGLYGDDAQAENSTTSEQGLDILSNGFKIRNSNTKQNTSGATYIFMAFAEAPFVNSNGVPTNAR